MLKRLLFICLTLLFFISVPSEVFAANTIIRKKTVRNVKITAGNRLTVQSGGKTYNTNILDGGIEDVFAGGVSQNATIRKGGILWLAGGKSFGATVENGGLMEVREHNEKKSYAADIKVMNGSRLNVYNDSFAEIITIHFGGMVRVYYPKALISDITIKRGGLLHVWKHGTAQNVYVEPGGILELREESPVLKGKIIVAGQLKASFDHKPDVSQAEIILDLPQRKTTDVYYIENLDYLGNAKISVNVSTDQKIGSYKIAIGAARWNDMLNITFDGQQVQSIRLWEPVEIAGKYYTLKRVNYKFIELTVSLDPPVSDELVPELEISQKHKDIFKSYGLEIIAENYSVSPSGRRFTQQELDKDVESMIKDLELLGEKCVRMSRTSKIFIRGSMSGGAHQSWDTLNFASGVAGAFRHEFNHNFEPFGVAYRFWSRLNNPRFVYRNVGAELPYREILNIGSNANEFGEEFERRYGQETIHEDITTIFAAATHPESAARCLEKSRKSPAYRKKLYLVIASYSEVLPLEWWEQFFDFTKEEKAQIKASYIDVESERNLKIFYTKSEPQRYSWQRLTTMGLLDLSPEILRAAGIRKIKFFEHPRSPQVQKDTLIYYERDHEAMAAGIFRECFRRHPALAKKYLSERPIDRWTWLFSVCTFKGFRDIARQSSTNAEMRRDVVNLQKFTSDWLSKDFWKEYDYFYEEYKKDQQYLKTFEKYGIIFSDFLPPTIQGEKCTLQEFEKAKHIFIACASILTSDFMKKCNIRSVVFANGLKINGQPVRYGISYIDGVLYIDQSRKDLIKNIFKQLYMLGKENLPEDARGNVFAETFAALLWNSHSAYMRAKTNNNFYEKVKIIMDLNILRPHAYETMNLNRIIECKISGAYSHYCNQNYRDNGSQELYPRLTFEQLGERVGISKGTVSKIFSEEDENGNPAYKELHIMWEVLGSKEQIHKYGMKHLQNKQKGR